MHVMKSARELIHTGHGGRVRECGRFCHAVRVIFLTLLIFIFNLALPHYNVHIEALAR